MGSRSPAARRNVERRRRRKVIPMGRFSYADQHRAVVTLSNWMRLVVRENVRVCGYLEADQVPLVTFLEAIAARSADKNRAFDRLCAFVGLRTPRDAGDDMIVFVHVHGVAHLSRACVRIDPGTPGPRRERTRIT